MKRERWHIFAAGLILIAIAVVAGQRFYEQITQQSDVAATPEEIAARLAGLTVDGWEMHEQVIRFTPENVYEQINGRAEFYLAYNMVEMIFASFEKSSDNGAFIDLSIFDMGTPTNAFGVFSGERSVEAPKINLGREGYRIGAYYYIWKGQYYYQIIASDTTVAYQQIGLDLAQQIAGFLHDSGEPVWGLTVLPETDRIPGSEQYFLVDAMGLDFMRNTYMARYNKDGTVVTVFLSKQGTPESAQTIVARFTDFAKAYDKEVIYASEGGHELAICDMGSGFDVIFQKDDLVAGVYGVADKNLAVRSAIDLLGQL